MNTTWKLFILANIWLMLEKVEIGLFFLLISFITFVISKIRIYKFKKKCKNLEIMLECQLEKSKHEHKRAEKFNKGKSGGKGRSKA